VPHATTRIPPVRRQQIDPAVGQVLAHVAQHVGKLHRDAEPYARLTKGDRCRAQHGAQYQADAARHIPAILVQHGEVLHLHWLKVHRNPVEEFEQWLERDRIPLQRIRQRQPALARWGGAGMHGDDITRELGEVLPHKGGGAVTSFIDEVVGVPAVVVESEYRAFLVDRQEATGEVKAPGPDGGGALRVAVAPLQQVVMLPPPPPGSGR
jgi:hypothetical protein